MIDVMTRLKVHHMAEGGTPQAVIAAKSGVSLRSVERILSESSPTLEEVCANARLGERRRGRPPVASDAVVDRVRELVALEPEISAIEVLRRARGWGYTGSRSTMSALVKSVRPERHREPVVRFEGLPGEYTQYDFGECKVRYADGRREKVTFFASRLKYSRFMHVELTPDQRAETLARAVVSSLVAFGGSSKEWVFDNPKTVRISPVGVEPPVLHAYLRELVAAYRTIPTLCTPRAPNQKGSVERLVKYVKRSFLLARKFRDRAHLEAELAGWLFEVNHERPSSATGVIPAVALRDEAPWLAERPVQTSPEDWAVRETMTVTPTGTISFAGTPYFATAKRIGAPATVFIRRHELEIVVGEERSVHRRVDGKGVLQMLPHQREDLLAAVHGRRKKATARREALLRIGQPAWAFLTILIHRHPDGRWEGPCEALFELLQRHGDDAMCAAFARCVAQQRYTVRDVADALGEAA